MGCHRAWGDMVEKLIISARSVGVPVINGERCCSLLTQDHDHCHSIKPDGNAAKYNMMYEHMINVAYAIVPRASDAALIRRPKRILERTLRAGGTSPTGLPAKAGAPPSPLAQQRGPRGPPLTEDYFCNGDFGADNRT